MEVTVKDRQSLLDVAVQCLGGIEGVFALAERNGIGITDRIGDGTVLSFDLADVVDERVRETYSNKGLAPATEITEDEMLVLLGEAAAERDGADDDAITDRLDQIIGALESGEDVESEGGMNLTSIFCDEYNNVFA